MTDRRRALRLPVQLRAHASTRTSSASVEVINLSRHGLLLKAPRTIPKMGSQVSVRVDLLEGPVDLPGEVVRVEDEGATPCAGIRFIRLDPHIRRELANYMIKRNYSAHA